MGVDNDLLECILINEGSVEGCAVDLALMSILSESASKGAEMAPAP